MVKVYGGVPQKHPYILKYAGALTQRGFITMAKEITIFCKKRQSKDGKKTFNSYLTTLTKKDGTTQTVSVKFREEAGEPKEFPCNILVEKKNVNLHERKYRREDTGEEAIGHTLWVTEWKKGSEYIDHSLDDFDI